MEAEFNERLAGHGMTRVAYAVLGAIHFDRKTTPSDLADFLGLDRGAVTRLLDKLEGQNLIARSRTDADRRVVSLLVTPKGEVLAAELRQQSQAVNAQFTTGLKPQEISEYIEIVKKMAENVRVNIETL